MYVKNGNNSRIVSVDGLEFIRKKWIKLQLFEVVSFFGIPNSLTLASE